MKPGMAVFSDMFGLFIDRRRGKGRRGCGRTTVTCRLSGQETAPGCAAGNAVLGPPSSRNGHAIIVHLIRRKFYLAALIHFDSRGRQIGNHGFGNCFSSKPVKGETSLSNVPAKMSPRIEGKTLFR
jgi:hypothetical protein